MQKSRVDEQIGNPIDEKQFVLNVYKENLNSIDIETISKTTIDMEGTGKNSIDMVGVEKNTIDLEGTQKQSIDFEVINKNTVDLEGTTKNSIDMEGVQKNTLDIDIATKNSIDMEGTNKQSIDIEGVSKNTIDMETMNKSSMDMEGTNKQSIDFEVINKNTVDLEGVSKQSIDMEGVSKNTIDLETTQKQSIDMEGTSKQSIDIEGVDKQSIDLETTNKQSLDMEGATKQSIDFEVTNKNTLELEGTQKQSIDIEGISKQSIDLEVQNKNSLDMEGTSKQSIDIDVIQKQSIDLEGIQKQSIELEGVNKQSIELEVINKQSIDLEGMQKQSIELEGLNKQSIDMEVSPKNSLDIQVITNTLDLDVFQKNSLDVQLNTNSIDMDINQKNSLDIQVNTNSIDMDMNQKNSLDIQMNTNSIDLETNQKNSLDVQVNTNSIELEGVNKQSIELDGINKQSIDMDVTQKNSLDVQLNTNSIELELFNKNSLDVQVNTNSLDMELFNKNSLDIQVNTNSVDMEIANKNSFDIQMNTNSIELEVQNKSSLDIQTNTNSLDMEVFQKNSLDIQTNTNAIDLKNSFKIFDVSDNNIGYTDLINRKDVCISEINNAKVEGDFITLDTILTSSSNIGTMSKDVFGTTQVLYEYDLSLYAEIANFSTSNPKMQYKNIVVGDISSIQIKFEGYTAGGAIYLGESLIQVSIRKLVKTAANTVYRIDNYDKVTWTAYAAGDDGYMSLNISSPAISSNGDFVCIEGIKILSTEKLTTDHVSEQVSIDFALGLPSKTKTFSYITINNKENLYFTSFRLNSSIGDNSAPTTSSLLDNSYINPLHRASNDLTTTGGLVESSYNNAQSYLYNDDVKTIYNYASCFKVSLIQLYGASTTKNIGCYFNSVQANTAILGIDMSITTETTHDANNSIVTLYPTQPELYTVRNTYRKRYGISDLASSLAYKKFTLSDDVDLYLIKLVDQFVSGNTCYTFMLKPFDNEKIILNGLLINDGLTSLNIDYPIITSIFVSKMSVSNISLVVKYKETVASEELTKYLQWIKVSEINTAPLMHQNTSDMHIFENIIYSNITNDYSGITTNEKYNKQMWVNICSYNDDIFITLSKVNVRFNTQWSILYPTSTHLDNAVGVCNDNGNAIMESYGFYLNMPSAYHIIADMSAPLSETDITMNLTPKNFMSIINCLTIDAITRNYVSIPEFFKNVYKVNYKSNYDFNNNYIYYDTFKAILKDSILYKSAMFNMIPSNESLLFSVIDVFYSDGISAIAYKNKSIILRITKNGMEQLTTLFDQIICQPIQLANRMYCICLNGIYCISDRVDKIFSTKGYVFKKYISKDNNSVEIIYDTYSIVLSVTGDISISNRSNNFGTIIDTNVNYTFTNSTVIVDDGSMANQTIIILSNMVMFKDMIDYYIQKVFIRLSCNLSTSTITIYKTSSPSTIYFYQTGIDTSGVMTLFDCTLNDNIKLGDISISISATDYNDPGEGAPKNGLPANDLKIDKQLQLFVSLFEVEL